MTPADLQAALDAATATLATRELRCWEGEYSPEPEQYAAAHARAVAQLRDPAGPLAPLLAVLAQTERERDEARARIARYVAALDETRASLEGPLPASYDAWEVADRRTHAAYAAEDAALAALRETPAGEGER